MHARPARTIRSGQPGRSDRRVTIPSSESAAAITAPSHKLWHAAALGMLGRLEELLQGASIVEINNAFWQACAGGQRRAAERLLAHGADLNWVPDYAEGTPLDQARSIDTGRRRRCRGCRNAARAQPTSRGTRGGRGDIVTGPRSPRAYCTARLSAVEPEGRTCTWRTRQISAAPILDASCS
jgi:hypothetical protein